MKILEVQDLKKVYTTRFNLNKCEALRSVSFSVEQGEFVAIMGESGSGKSTLLNIIASLLKQTAGYVGLAGKNIAEIKDSQLSAFRRDHLGFVFQDFNLLDNFSVKDNMLLPMVLAQKPYDLMLQRVQEVAALLKITDLLEKFPYEISGGEKQRTAIGRAIITNPELLLADEPTGALDSKASERILRLFQQINETGQTILMVTHSVRAASKAKRVLFIKDGQVFNEIYKAEQTDDAFYQKIMNTLAVMTNGGE
ncbi:ABC transporter ATP-binding protein [Clostridiales bacterium COT073_COT-073]|nr:ABC transporter ATP-binding protein [Clostridiales bacterium COT073_COT-073]